MKKRTDYRTTALSASFNAIMSKIALGFLALWIVAFAVAQIEQQQNDKKEDTSPASGQVLIEIYWPDGLDVDIDLLVLSPNDDHPVTYLVKSGKSCNLIRDDRGRIDDPLPQNHETVVCRGIAPGEWVINFHYFGAEEKVSEVPVTLDVRVQKDASSSTKSIFTRVAVLHKVGEQITAARFSLDEGGALQKGSINDLYKELRLWK